MSPSSISPDFPFESRFAQVHGSQIHYVEEGTGDPILFLHGNPTSSYLWRNIIPHLSSFGRCIAPDLIGMGKSDKPDIEYRFIDHYRYIEGFIENLNLKNITLVLHDWGSALGFQYAMGHEDNIKGLAFMEAILLPMKSWDIFPPDMKEIFQAFRTPKVGEEMILNKNFFVEKILPGAIVRDLSEEEMNQYRQPFPTPESRKPLWRWPNEIPIAGHPPDMVKVVNQYNQKLQQSSLPKLLFYAHPGAIMTEPVVQWCQDHLKNLKSVDLGKGIHYLQEDHPHRIGEELARWYQEI